MIEQPQLTGVLPLLTHLWSACFVLTQSTRQSRAASLLEAPVVIAEVADLSFLSFNTSSSPWLSQPCLCQPSMPTTPLVQPFAYAFEQQAVVTAYSALPGT